MKQLEKVGSSGIGVDDCLVRAQSYLKVYMQIAMECDSSASFALLAAFTRQWARRWMHFTKIFEA